MPGNTRTAATSSVLQGRKRNGAGSGRPDAVAVERDLDAEIGQRREVRRGEGVEAAGVGLDGAVAAQEDPAEADADLGQTVAGRRP